MKNDTAEASFLANGGIYTMTINKCLARLLKLNTEQLTNM